MELGKLRHKTTMTHCHHCPAPTSPERHPYFLGWEVSTIGECWVQEWVL